MENRLHHSLSDWDFLYRDDWDIYNRYDLYPTLYVSPPTCLRFDPGALDIEQYALCNLPETLNLKAGRLTTWSRAQSSGVGNSYVYLGVTGPGLIGIRLGLPKTTSSWGRNRFDWWQGYDGVGDPATLIAWYTWVDDEWTGPFMFTEPPMTGAVNRCGIGITGQSLSADKYFDDTEIWLPI